MCWWTTTWSGTCLLPMASGITVHLSLPLASQKTSALAQSNWPVGSSCWCLNLIIIVICILICSIKRLSKARPCCPSGPWATAWGKCLLRPLLAGLDLVLVWGCHGIIAWWSLLLSEHRLVLVAGPVRSRILPYFGWFWPWPFGFAILLLLFLSDWLQQYHCHPVQSRLLAYVLLPKVQVVVLWWCCCSCLSPSVVLGVQCYFCTSICSGSTWNW